MSVQDALFGGDLAPAHPQRTVLSVVARTGEDPVGTGATAGRCACGSPLDDGRHLVAQAAAALQRDPARDH